MLRAIYIPDVRFDVCNVFEFSDETRKFHMISNPEMTYDFDVVMEDPDFITFVTEGEIVYMIEPKGKGLE